MERRRRQRLEPQGQRHHQAPVRPRGVQRLDRRGRHTPGRPDPLPLHRSSPVPDQSRHRGLGQAVFPEDHEPRVRPGEGFASGCGGGGGQVSRPDRLGVREDLQRVHRGRVLRRGATVPRRLLLLQVHGGAGLGHVAGDSSGGRHGRLQKGQDCLHAPRGPDRPALPGPVAPEPGVPHGAAPP